jgi:hypothetical protein
MVYANDEFYIMRTYKAELYNQHGSKLRGKQMIEAKCKLTVTASSSIKCLYSNSDYVFE